MPIYIYFLYLNVDLKSINQKKNLRKFSAEGSKVPQIEKFGKK